MDFFVDHAVGFALACAAVAVLYGLYLTWWLLKQPAGNERMQEIARAVQEGAAAYLRKQYTTIAIVAIVPFFLLGFYDKLGWGAAFGFLIGAVFSAAAGFIGMNVAVRSNVRTAEAARDGLQPAFKVAFRAGSVTGLLVVGLGLLGVAGYYWVLTDWIGNSPQSAVDDLIGLAFGGSLISVFARLGGGIYTKAADVGADLVGKIEAGIPEDDPRNPAVIADNVGDNVGDCAGMAADLFETYAVTAVAVMLLGIGIGQSDLWLYPLALGGISILSSVIGTFFTRVGSGPNAIINALYRGVIVATVLSALGFIPVTMAYDGGDFDFWNLYGSALIGLAVTFLLVAITEYYTGTRWKPVKDIAKASQTGPRDEHHLRPRRGHAGDGAAGRRHRDRHRRRVLRGGREPLRHRCRRHGAALDGRAHRRPRRVRPGDRQRGRDRRDGRPSRRRVRGITDPLDAVGNTTKAVTKGYAIGSAGLAALILFDEYGRGLRENGLESFFSLDNPWVVAGLFIGGLMPFLFASLAMQAVGRVGGQVVEEVRRQFRENPGIMAGTSRPDYSKAIGIVTASAIKEMLAPALIPVADPDRRRDHLRRDARRAPHRHDRHRALPRDRDDLRRRRLGQREEDDRGRALRREGLRRPCRGGHRRHGRRPVQGHRRPRDQPDDQDREHRRDPHDPAPRLDPRLGAL